MADVYRNYKLSSGDEIIGKVVGVNDEFITIFRPMSIKVVTLQDPMSGEQKNITMMRPWVVLSDSLEHRIPTNHIVLQSSPSQHIVGAYLNKLDKEDVVQDLVQEMMENPEQLEDFLQEMVENDLQEEEEEQQTPLPEEPDSEKVQMNFQMPPGLFLGFLMNGIISFNEDAEGEFDVDKFLNMKNGNRSRKPNKDKDIEDYFRDWSPEP